MFLHSEVSPNGTSYATTFEFVISSTISGTIDYSISNVKNYAGTVIASANTGKKAVTARITSFNVPENIEIAYKSNKTVSISANSALAAAGKTIKLSLNNAYIAQLSSDTVVFDENGQAKFTVNTKLPGEVVISYEIVGTTLTGETKVYVGLDVEPEVPHTCEYTAFSHYESEHPHYAVYKCSCGETKVDTTKTTTFDFCETCNPSTPEGDYKITINTPSIITIRCKDGIKLHANVTGTLPEGAKIVWSTNNKNFTTKQIDDETFQIVSKNNGYTTVTVAIVDADGNILASDSVEMRSKAGFGDKIGAFFRSLFGGTKIYEN